MPSPHSSPPAPSLGLRGAVLDWMLAEGRPTSLPWAHLTLAGGFLELLRHTGHRFTARFSQLTGPAAGKALLGAGTDTVPCLSCGVPQGWHLLSPASASDLSKGSPHGLPAGPALLRLSMKESLTPSSRLSRVCLQPKRKVSGSGGQSLFTDGNTEAQPT